MIKLKVKVGDNIEVGRRIAEFSKFRIYLGTTKDMKPVILKIAKTFEDGDLLAQEAGEFNMLQYFERRVFEFETNQGKPNSHYDWLFAKLLSSFMESSQDDHRINVFSISDIDFDSLVPLSKLSKDVRIDPRTGVWILGRLFKFYSFFELLAIERDDFIPRYPLFSPDDYLIGPVEHRLIYYNFSGDIADVVAFDFVKAIAGFVLGWTDTVKGDIEGTKFLELLRDFSKHGRETFEMAHAELYKLVRELWGINYYPFTYCRIRGTGGWVTMEEE